MEFAKELYEHGALDEENFNHLQDNKNTNNKTKSIIEKDDIERWINALYHLKLISF